MRVLQFASPGEPRVIDIPKPTPGPTEVVVKVEAVSTCPQWDLHIMDGVPMFEGRPLEYPYVPGEPGHELVGFIDSTGGDVTDFKKGDRVAAWRDPGGRKQGCYAEFVCIESDHLLSVSNELAAKSIASLELAMCVQVSFDQLEEVGGVQDKHVGIAGLGPAGLIAVQMAVAYGASRVSCIEPHEGRRLIGSQVGANEVLVPEDVSDGRIRFETGLDTTGLKPVIENLMALSSQSVAIFGVLREPVSFGPEKWWGNFKLMGYGEHNKEAARRALNLINEGRLDLGPLISGTCSFDNYADAVESLRRKKSVKVLVQPAG